MTERAINPGSGPILRTAYTRLVIVMAIAFAVMLVLVGGITIAAVEGPNLLTAAVGLTGLVIGFLLLLVALLRGRSAVHTDSVAIPPMRASGNLAVAAQCVGLVGAVATLVVALLRSLADVDLAWTVGLLAAFGSLTPALLGFKPRELSLRYTA